MSILGNAGHQDRPVNTCTRGSGDPRVAFPDTRCTEVLRSDNGPEFVADAVCQWLAESGCQTLFITPGSPWENGYIESFIDKLRDECLNREVFWKGAEARTIVGIWTEEYNQYRPYSSLGYLTPVEYARRYRDRHQEAEARQPEAKAGALSS